MKVKIKAIEALSELLSHHSAEAKEAFSKEKNAASLGAFLSII